MIVRSKSKLLSWWQPSRWQQGWVVFRNTGMLGALYLSGIFLLQNHWVIWFYLTLEASNRYFPLWLQLMVLTFLGWQLDVLFAWPLGSGVVVVALATLWLRYGQAWRQAPTYLMWRLLGWLIANWLLVVLIGLEIFTVSWWLQTLIYVLIIGLLWRRGK